jgi:hypothetical protein
MRDQSLRKRDAAAWALARRQHAVVGREQLLALGFTAKAIKHRIAIGRLHPKWRGVYAVGRPELTRRGEWMAAVLSCGPTAALSHASAAALWGLRPDRGGIEVVVAPGMARERPGIVVHRGARDVARVDAIPVTSATCTLVDLAATLPAEEIEAAINEADKRDLIDPEALREALEAMAVRRGLKALKRILDRRTFTLTDSQLEPRFRPLARAAGLPRPQTRVYVDGFRVDFTGRSSTWSSRPTGCATTARRRSRPATACAIRRTLRPAGLRCASRTPRWRSSPSTYARRSPPSRRVRGCARNQ